MFIQEISIQIVSDADKDQLVDEFTLLLGYYRSSGQTQGRIEAQYIQNNLLVATPFTLEENSLSSAYNNLYVNRQIRKLEEPCQSQFTFKTLGKTNESYSGPCTCECPSYYLLYTNYITILSPIICGNCDKTVPLYKLPKYHDDGYFPILSWETNYQSCDALQMNCEVGERWATKQMTDYTSQLSKQGISICQRIEELTGTPTYYYLFNYRKLSVKQDKQRKCPPCKQDWLLETQLHGMYDFKCDTCRLISSVTTNN